MSLRYGFCFLILALCSPLLTLPLTRFGYFMQIDAMICAFWIAGAFSGFWAYFFSRHYPRFAKVTACSPAVWGPFSLALLSFGFGFFQTMPLKNWFGSGQMAEGALTFLSTACLSFVMIILARYQPYRRAMFWAALVSGTILSTLTFIGHRSSPFVSWQYWKWAPFFFNDYLGFILIGIAGLYLSMTIPLKKLAWGWQMVAGSYFALLTYISLSSTLQYGLILGLMTVVILRQMPFKHQRFLCAFGFTLFAISITAFLLCYDGFASCFPKLHNASIESRGRLLTSLMLTLQNADSPWQMLKTFLIGTGWNSYGDHLTLNLFNINRIFLFQKENWDPSWEIFDRDLIHSHNIIGEHFSALGFLGIVILLISRWHLIYALPKRNFYGAVFILMTLHVMQLLWFLFPNTLPFTVLAIACLCGGPSIPFLAFIKRLSPYLHKGLPWFSALLLCSSLCYGFNDIFLSQRFQIVSEANLLDVFESYLNVPTPIKRFDIAIGGQRMINYAKHLHDIAMEFAQENPQIDPVPLLDLSLKMADRVYENHPAKENPLALITAITIYTNVSSWLKAQTWFYEDESHLKQWGKLNQTLIETMPSRADLAIPYFNALLEHKKTRLCLKQTQGLLDKEPDNPVGLWFYGTSLLQDRSLTPDKGIRFLQRSLNKGIGRFIPIPETERQQILEFKV